MPATSPALGLWALTRWCKNVPQSLCCCSMQESIEPDELLNFFSILDSRARDRDIPRYKSPEPKCIVSRLMFISYIIIPIHKRANVIRIRATTIKNAAASNLKITASGRKKTQGNNKIARARDKSPDARERRCI